MDILTTGCGLLAAWAAVPALDALLRWRRLAAPHGGARPDGRAPGRILAVIPSRSEGARVGDLPGDVRREISLKVKRVRIGDGGPTPDAAVDVLVVLDGPDPDAEARLVRDGVPYLSKKSSGPSKGHALAFVGEQLAERLDSYEFILVFDADMRLPDGFFRDLLRARRHRGLPAAGPPFGRPGAGGAARRGALPRRGAPRRPRARRRRACPCGCAARPWAFRRARSASGRRRRRARRPRTRRRRCGSAADVNGSRARRPRRVRRARVRRRRDGALARALVRRAPEALLRRASATC